VSLLSEVEQQQVSSAIEAVEQKTDAELVTVLARRSDDYFYIPTLWAAMIALFTPPLLSWTPLWLDSNDFLLIQLLTFVSLAVLLRWQPLMILLIPKSVRYWRASNMARRQFIENNLHHTRGDSGVLIFVSEAEHYVEIIADRGINQLVSEDQWQVIVEHFIKQVKVGLIAQGFINAVEQCGELLIEHVPATDQQDELPNRLIIIE
jgi:putative membrane protein